MKNNKILTTTESEEYMTATEFEECISEALKCGREFAYASYIVSFTPAEARSFYNKHYYKNRTLSEQNVRKYRNLMELDKFDRNIGNTILLDSKAHMLDAHHRLAALSEVENPSYSYQFIVVLGANPSVYIDTGKRRTPVDNVAMMENTTEDDMTILDGIAGKALKVYARMLGKKGAEATFYLADAIRNTREACQNFANAAGSFVGNNRYLPTDGCIAGIFDQFLKGNIDSRDVAIIIGVLSKYNYALHLEKNPNTPFQRRTDARVEAQDSEKKHFGTENIWSSLAENIKKIGSGQKKQQEQFYLVTTAIQHCKSGDDVAVKTSLSSRYCEKVNECRRNAFDITKYKENYELIEKMEDGTPVCYVSQVAA